MHYWLVKRGQTQADLARATQIQPKTISRIVRGFHTQTSMLSKIAWALQVPLADVLVSPDRRIRDDERRRIALEAAEYALRNLGGGSELPAATGAIESALNTMVERVEQRTEGSRQAHKRPKRSKR